MRIEKNLNPIVQYRTALPLSGSAPGSFRLNFSVPNFSVSCFTAFLIGFFSVNALASTWQPAAGPLQTRWPKMFPPKTRTRNIRALK